MNDDADANQLYLPPSFVACHADARGRLTRTLATVRARYELCEDMAQALVEQVQRLHVDGGDEQFTALQRVRNGLHDPAAGMEAAEADWVVQRLAELLEWRCPVGCTALHTLSY